MSLCNRCGKQEAATYVRFGVVYSAGVCLDCSDLEWSERFDRQWEKASMETRVDLAKVLDLRTKAGRRYVGKYRPGAPAPADNRAGVDR